MRASRRLQVAATEDGLRLQDFLAARLGVSRSRAKQIVDGRGVFVNACRVWMARHTLRRGDAVELTAAATPAPPDRKSVV